MPDQYDSTIGPRSGGPISQALGDALGTVLPYTANTGPGSLAAHIPGTKRSLALMPALEIGLPVAAARVAGLAQAANMSKRSKLIYDAIMNEDWEKLKALAAAFSREAGTR